MIKDFLAKELILVLAQEEILCRNDKDQHQKDVLLLTGSAIIDKEF